jgi:hypothetical protein
MEIIRYFIYVNGKELEVDMWKYYRHPGAKARTIKRRKTHEQ